MCNPSSNGNTAGWWACLLHANHQTRWHFVQDRTPWRGYAVVTALLASAGLPVAQAQNHTSDPSPPLTQPFNGSSKDTPWWQTTPGLVGLVASVAAVVLLLFGCLWWRKKRHKNSRRAAPATDVEMAPNDSPMRGSMMMHDWVPAQLYGFRHPPSTEAELLRDLSSPIYRTILSTQIKLLENIGSGSFGDVHRALYEAYEGQNPPQEVAVRMAPSDATLVAKLKLLQAAVIFGQFRHKNVARLVGVVTEDVPFPLVVTEYLQLGPLDRHLRLTQASMKSQLLMARDIAAGMNYLALCSFVFGNLNAGHVLVDRDGTCKIAGLGLTSRDMSDRSDRAQRVDIRWASPELYPKLATPVRSRKDGTVENDDFVCYTSESDVWAFGVVLFEIWTNGKLPYGVTWDNRLVMSEVLGGYRLPPPLQCPREIYRAMIMCWHPEASQRPSFAQLQTLIEGVMELLPAIPHTATSEGFPDLEKTYAEKPAAVHLQVSPRHRTAPRSTSGRPVSPLIPRTLMTGTLPPVATRDDDHFGFEPDTPGRPQQRPIHATIAGSRRRYSEPVAVAAAVFTRSYRPPLRSAFSDAPELPPRQSQVSTTSNSGSALDRFRPEVELVAEERQKRITAMDMQDPYMTISATIPRRRQVATFDRRPKSQVVTESDYMTVMAAVESVKRERARQEEAARVAAAGREMHTSNDDGSTGDSDSDADGEAAPEFEPQPTAVALAMKGLGADSLEAATTTSPSPTPLSPRSATSSAACTSPSPPPWTLAGRRRSASPEPPPRLPSPRKLSSRLPDRGPPTSNHSLLPLTAAARKRRTIPFDEPDLLSMSEAERAAPGTELPVMERQRLHSSKTSSRRSSEGSRQASTGEDPVLSSGGSLTRQQFLSSRSNSYKEHGSPSLTSRPHLRLALHRQSHVDAASEAGSTDTDGRISPTPGSLP
eukprot:m.154855 g.154855  ORF g.154855 m.154855 type:complete len:934 (+) comp17511_c0_seq2:311-3112(+)